MRRRLEVLKRVAESEEWRHYLGGLENRLELEARDCVEAGYDVRLCMGA